MGRKKDDKIWQEFEQMGGVSKCKHCKVEFKGKPSVFRLRKHLLGDKGGGICVCTKVSDHVKAALLDDFNKRRRIEPTPINNGVENSSLTSSQQQSQHFEQVQRMQEAVQDEEEEMNQVTQLRKENKQILSGVIFTTDQYLSVEADNSILRARMAELGQRLDFLNEILNFIHNTAAAVATTTSTSGVFQSQDLHTGLDDHLLPCFTNPQNFVHLNQPIVASPDLFQY